MSSFSSVVRKPGQKIAPKVAPKRVTRRPAATSSSVVAAAQPEDEQPTQPTHEQSRSPPPESNLSAEQNDATTPASSFVTGQDVGVANSDNHTLLASNVANGSRPTDETTTQTQEGAVQAAKTTRPRAASNNRPQTIQPPTSSSARPRDSSTPLRAASELSRASSVQSDIESATQRLSTISDIARQIDPTLDNRRRSARISQTPGRATDTEADESSARPAKKRKRNPKSKTIEQQAAEVVANATGETDLRPRKRRRTPEDVVDHEIQQENTTMGELCKDHKWGKKSAIEQQMQANWPEILRRRKEDRDRALRDLETRRAKRAGAGAASQPTAEDLARLQGQATAQLQDVPEQIIVNGQIVIAQESREIDRSAHLEQVLEDPANQVQEDADIYKRVNQATVGMKNAIPPGERWDEASTALFYQGLRMFGTDFMMISKMIPGKSRRQVKLKYNVEERSNLGRVNRNVAEKQHVDLDEYGQMANLQFKNADDVYKQIEEDEKRLRAEDERRRQDEGIIPQRDEQQDTRADVAMPSIEQDGTEPLQDGEDAGQIERERTVNSTATGTRQATQPAATKKRQPRKTQPSKPRRSKYDITGATFQGVEERIGDADSVGV